MSSPIPDANDSAGASNDSTPNPPMNAAQAHVDRLYRRVFTNSKNQKAADALDLASKLTNPQPPALDKDAQSHKNIVSLWAMDSFSAARELHNIYPNDKIAVLNMANAFTPGGGFMAGGRAQEEDLCHCSTLYPTLRPELYPMADNELIYSPDVLVLKEKDQDGHRRLPQDDQFYVDVISCAAVSRPTLGKGKRVNNDGVVEQIMTYTDPNQRQLMMSKIRWILHAAVSRNVQILVLGAFGCGVFRNPIPEVARMMKEVLLGLGDDGPSYDWSKSSLLMVVIAIYDPSTPRVVLNGFRDEFRHGEGLHTRAGLLAPQNVMHTQFPSGYEGVDI